MSLEEVVSKTVEKELACKEMGGDLVYVGYDVYVCKLPNSVTLILEDRHYSVHTKSGKIRVNDLFYKMDAHDDVLYIRGPRHKLRIYPNSVRVNAGPLEVELHVGESQ